MIIAAPKGTQSHGNRQNHGVFLIICTVKYDEIHEISIVVPRHVILIIISTFHYHFILIFLHIISERDTNCVNLILFVPRPEARWKKAAFASQLDSGKAGKNMMELFRNFFFLLLLLEETSVQNTLHNPEMIIKLNHKMK